MKRDYSRSASFAIVALVYVLAFAAGVLAFAKVSAFMSDIPALLVAVWYWGIRLTGNWAYTFKGLRHEDWRYLRYREQQSPLLFHLTNFFGLNMMPTLLVFACMVPGFLL